MLVLFAHGRDARAPRSQVQGLFGKSCAIVSAHVTPVRTQPLLELDPHFGLYGCGVRAWLDAANQL